MPNGLTTGGLKVAPGVPANLAQPTASENPALWTGAALPTQTTANGQTNVSIVQTSQQAVLNWQTFNVGRGTNVTFDQTAGGAVATQWIAFNKINDPSGVPSQILGSINAVGQVYLINANGIIFGGSSQINLHTLVASALPINDNLIARGLLNNPDNQFLFSALPLPSGTNGTPAFTPGPTNTPGGFYGDVTVQAGATLTSPTSADNVGGRIALFGANVRNDGTISTPDGQTILAAGLQVGLAAHASTESFLAWLGRLRGLHQPLRGKRDEQRVDRRTASRCHPRGQQGQPDGFYQQHDIGCRERPDRLAGGFRRGWQHQHPTDKPAAISLCEHRSGHARAEQRHAGCAGIWKHPASPGHKPGAALAGEYSRLCDSRG